MKLRLYTSLLFLLICFAVLGQDEGSVVIKNRFERNKTAYFSLGPSFTVGKNLGDYTTGFAFEAGFLKRANKLLSWGPSLSYTYFAYDASKSYKYYYDVGNDLALELKQDGGDVSILSLGFNAKLSLIPVSDNSKISVYGIINPFVSYVSRSEVTEDVDAYSYDVDTDKYDSYSGSVSYTGKDYPALASKDKTSGGAHVGFGVELFPAKMFSFFAQATFTYTLPVSYLATKSFLKDIPLENQYADSSGSPIYYDASKTLYLNDFPVVEKGFSSLSVKVGMAFNF